MMSLHRKILAAVIGLLATSRAQAFFDTHQKLDPSIQESADAPSKLIHVSGGVMAGNLLIKVSPVVSDEVCASSVEGGVLMHVLIGRDGRVKSAEPISGPPLLRQPYLDAVRQWTYKPYLLNGQPVEVQTTVSVNPQLNCVRPTAMNSSAQKSVEASKPVRISSGVMAGNILTKIMPQFPEEARMKHVNGAVVIHVVIGKDGRIKSAEAIYGPELLRSAFVDAVKQWTYKPYLLNGEPVEVDTTISVSVQMNAG